VLRGRVRLIGATALAGVVVGTAFLGPMLVGVLGTTQSPPLPLRARGALPEALTRLRFEENGGQIGLDARFVLRLQGAGIAFEASGPVVYAGTGSVRMRFGGGNKAPDLEGTDRGAQGDVIQVSFGTGNAVDAARNSYLGGWTETTHLLIQGGFQPELRGEYDGFVMKILPG